MYFVISMDIDTDTVLGHIVPGRVLDLPDFAALVADVGHIISTCHQTMDQALDWSERMYGD